MPDDQPQLTPHDAAMVARVDAAAVQVAQAAPTPAGQVPGGAPAAAPAVAPAQRPDTVPEKFWDAEKGSVNTEALLKSYAELEKGKAPPAPGAPVEPPATPGEAEKAVAEAKLDIDKLSAEFAVSGALSEESYKALEAAGYDKGLVDKYIAGQVAVAAQKDAQGYELAGGKDQWASMATWARANLSADEIGAFDSAVNGTPAQMKQAVTALKAQFEAANGNTPKLLNGSQGEGSDTEPAFQSRAEVTAAMRDSRYRADPAYRAQVERRIGKMENF